MDRPDQAPKRCFVGLWPDADVAERLDALSQELHRSYPYARCVPRANLHLTLAFIGDLPSQDAARVATRLPQFAVEPCTWCIDRIGQFAGPRVVWAGGPTPAALQALVGAVQVLLSEAKVAFERRPYVPHVTLLRHVPRSATIARMLDAPIAWLVRRPVLLQSQSGRYVEVAAQA